MDISARLANMYECVVGFRWKIWQVLISTRWKRYVHSSKEDAMSYACELSDPFAGCCCIVLFVIKGQQSVPGAPGFSENDSNRMRLKAGKYNRKTLEILR